jgi:hypothetical protein
MMADLMDRQMEYMMAVVMGSGMVLNLGCLMEKLMAS